MSNWQFDSIKSETTEGWNQGGITTFRDKILKNLVREVLQNSLDNPADKNQEAPVRVCFRDLKIAKERIPGINSLVEQLDLCVLASQNAAAEQKEEVRRARRVLEDDKLRTLLIEDYNTSGMSGGSPGPCERFSPFFNYIKAEGAPDANDDRGGSHGLGKNAPLISSVIRTIFASTCWHEGNEPKSLIQGRCQLMTRDNPDHNGELLVPRGYWGADGFDPLTACPDEYSWLSRNGDQGTTIAVPGWYPDKNWESLVIGYALINFFAAFQRGKLILEVGKYTVSESNLADYFNNEHIGKQLKGHDPENEADWLLAKALYGCLEQNDTEFEEFQCPGRIGKGHLKVVVAEGLPSKLAFIRQNILITSEIPGFYRRVPGSIQDFVAIYECTNSAGLSLLRGMEPPQHNGLAHDFLPFHLRREGQNGLANLTNKLKEIIRDKAGIEDGGRIADQATLEFFHDDAGDGGDINDDEDIDPEGLLTISIKPRKLPPPKKIKTEEELEEGDVISEDEAGEEGGAGEEGNGGSGGNGHGPGEGDGSGGSGEKGLERGILDEAIIITNERFLRRSPSSGVVKFIIPKGGSGTYELCLFEVGADAISLIRTDEILSDNVDIGKKGLLVSADKEGEVKIEFNLKRPLLGGLKIAVNKANVE